MKNPIHLDWDYVVNYDKPKKEKLSGTIADIRPIMTYHKKVKDEYGNVCESTDVDDGIFKALRTERVLNFLGCDLESFCTLQSYFEFTITTLNGETLEDPIIFFFDPEEELISTIVDRRYKEPLEEFYETLAEEGIFSGYNSYTRNTCEPDSVTIEFDTTEAFNEALRLYFKDYVPKYYFNDLFSV